jgi:hypothetical protein
MNNKLIMNVELDGENETLERKGFLTSKKKWQSRAQNSPDNGENWRGNGDGARVSVMSKCIHSTHFFKHLIPIEEGGFLASSLLFFFFRLTLDSLW